MRRKGISGGTLKWIALLSMLVDHFTEIFYVGGWYFGRQIIFPRPLYYFLRGVGRLAFPIYCFLLVEGFLHTHNVKRYLTRLFLFGLVSEFPFDLAFRRSPVDWSYQNVYFTLFLGLLALVLWRLIVEKEGRTKLWVRLCAGLAVLGAIALLAKFCHTDYGAWGVLTIAALYFFRASEWQRDLFSGCALLGASSFEVFGLLDFFLFHWYDGRRGRQPKYLFYVFYPAHLLILALACRAVFGVL